MWKSRLYFLLGCWLLILSGLELIPLFTAAILSEFAAFQALFSAFILTVLIGGALFLGFRSTEKIRIPKLTIILPVAGAFILAWGAGLPFFFLFPDEGMVPALYEGMSLITTNGTSAYEGLIREGGYSIELWRGLASWIGGFLGLSIILSFLTAMNIGGLQLHRSPLAFGDSEAGYPRMKATAHTLLPLYLTVTACCMFFLLLSGVTFADAVLLAFGIISTSGFSPELSYNFNNIGTQIFTIIFLIVSISNWDVQYAFWRRKKLDHSMHSELRTSLLMSGMLLLLLIYVMPVETFRTFIDHAFAVISSVATFGLYPEAYTKTVSNSVDVSIILLVGAGIGGAVVGTSGGLKQLRAIVVFFAGKAEVERLAHPHSVKGIIYQKDDVQRSDIEAVWLFLGGFVFILAMGTILLGILGIHFQDALSMSFSALTLSGPIIDIVDPDFGGFTGLQDADYFILTFLMMIGRIEVSLFFALFSKALWRG
ncbi:TrkH family potassium uptake protein [Kordiimonas sp. SCSIO 12603]|uniref:potassium transporter TrkG n=1 Tax=Kordiimonas sp. SCSIO 12603 TaxID=2829596 RepID=UPI0021074028|nr:potassium transporter TrkG [Kordiimonas sp. SCSIO 12603]UTW57437.1 TrkH family potassium uptake protein [Kordiimonas sp. SCSIO 12603]